MSDTPLKSDETPKPPRLTVKQQQFVEAVVTGMPNKQAVVAAGYNVKSPQVAKDLAHTLMNNPKVQVAITARIKEKFPDVEGDAAEFLVNTMKDPEEGTAARLKALELLAKFFGWNAPTKHASVSVQGQFKLPE